jgi:hypothetical protein
MSKAILYDGNASLRQPSGVSGLIVCTGAVSPSCGLSLHGSALAALCIYTSYMYVFIAMPLPHLPGISSCFLRRLLSSEFCYRDTMAHKLPHRINLHAVSHAACVATALPAQHHGAHAAPAAGPQGPHISGPQLSQCLPWGRPTSGSCMPDGCLQPQQRCCTGGPDHHCGQAPGLSPGVQQKGAGAAQGVHCQP